MTAKEYLGLAYRLNKVVERRKELTKSHHDSLYGTGINYEGNGGKSTSGDTLGKAIVDVADYEAQTDEMIAELVEIRFMIEKSIELINNDNQKAVLTNRYLLYMDWKSRYDKDTGERLSLGICEKMKYSEEAIYKFHREGLKKISVPKMITVKYSELQR